MAPTRIFISSVQQELAAERRAVKDFVHNDALLRQHYEVFLFEDLPARDRRADAVYSVPRRLAILPCILRFEPPTTR